MLLKFWLLKLKVNLEIFVRAPNAVETSTRLVIGVGHAACVWKISMLTTQLEYSELLWFLYIYITMGYQNTIQAEKHRVSANLTSFVWREHFWLRISRFKGIWSSTVALMKWFDVHIQLKITLLNPIEYTELKAEQIESVDSWRQLKTRYFDTRLQFLQITRLY